MFYSVLTSLFTYLFIRIVGISGVVLLLFYRCWCCVRLRILWTVAVDGLVAYDVRQGDRRGTDLDFFDYTYDGAVVAGGNRLVGGLGQLTDGDEGTDRFRQHDAGGAGQRGYEWVGWKTAEYSGDNEYVEIVFHFDQDRNFTSVTFHVNNAFSRDVRVFRAATFHFERRHSTAVMTSVPVSVEFEYERDDVIEYARHVTVPLQQRVGQLVVARLYFDDRWIMISEVQFHSGQSLNPLTNCLLTLFTPRWHNPPCGSVVGFVS